MVTNRAAIAVGTAYHSSEDMYMAGRRGKGVKILHCYGDQLWQSGTRVELPSLGPPEGLDFLNNSEENQYESDDDESESANNDEENKETDDQEAVEDSSEDKINDAEKALESVKLEEVEGEENEAPADDRSPQEIMDELLENAFLQAWKTSAKKAELPMLTSNFFRVHMVPQCPKDKVTKYFLLENFVLRFPKF